MSELRSGIDYPGTWSVFQDWFATDADCTAYLERLRWPNGFVCPSCGTVGGWRIADGRFSCSGCASKVSVTAGTIFHRTRTPLRTWFATAWYLTGQKQGVSALGLQRALGIPRYETAWTMLHKFRSAMVRPGRERLSGDVEVDESFVGGKDHWTDGRQTFKKAIVVIAVERDDPKGLGRVRLARVPDFSGKSLLGFIADSVEAGSTVLTDGLPSYNGVGGAGFVHNRIVLSASDDPAHVAMPGVHRVASLLKRWILGTHQGAPRPEHLDAYLNEFTFRFNRRRSRSRGLLFYRLLEQAVVTDPLPYREIVAAR